MSATLAATFSANPILVFKPVPTAVPPNKNNCNCKFQIMKLIYNKDKK